MTTFDKHDEVALEEIIKLSGKYLSYEEFIRQIPSLSDVVHSNKYYKICNGETRGKTVRQLKKQFDKSRDEFEKRRNEIYDMLDFVFEEVE